MTKEEISWPESCEFYSDERGGFGAFHKCKHSKNDLCTPCGCPKRKIGEYQEKLDRYEDELMSASGDEVSWLENEIKWLTDKIAELMGGIE